MIQIWRILACGRTGSRLRQVSIALSLMGALSPLAALEAQVTAPGPVVRRIESAQAVSTEPLGSINGVRHLSDGRVLVNDGNSRRILIFDSTLTRATVVLDSLSESRNYYGARGGLVIPSRGDATLFVDPISLAMLTLDGTGRITRVGAVPIVTDIGAMTSGQFGMPDVEAKGRIVYRIDADMAQPARQPDAGTPYAAPIPDTAFVIAVSPDTRKIDTLGAIHILTFLFSTRLEPEGYYSYNYISHPLPVVDAWAVLSDGTVAFVRGIDYRVEYRTADGVVTSSEKLPYPWVRLTEDDKARFADSVNARAIRDAQFEFATLVIAWSNLVNKPYPSTFTVPENYTLPPGLPRDWILPKGLSFPANYLAACPPGANSLGSITVACARSRFVDAYGGGYAPPPPTYRAPTKVKPQDLPDYKPPIGVGAARADADGNLWVRPIQPRTIPGGQIFDVINRQGVMIDRIQLPTGYQLAGFGPNKIVYLSNRDASGVHLSRVRLR